MTAKEITKRLVGRTIVAARARAFPTGNQGSSRRGQWAHDWLLTLDDGTRISFDTQETECGEYGIRIHLNQGEVR